ncbi:PH domain-containing protein [Microbacterium sp. TNHR37B]|uniref:PH domain-containing protein n=1 Tax=Microbacterium sp. TNHR37B TaxID=1775956 RepID=UPI0007B2509A|nr:PH domain-containing protein [Microbacterium sp. TNHR37B]KZE89103.1 hypothetical protein AVP41_01894 [Microbacterium sp. TNHR37B]
MANEEKLVRLATEHLDADEQIQLTMAGTYEVKMLGNDTVRAGVLIATDRRVVFYAKKLGGYELESFAYDRISSFEAGKSMMGGHITFFASGNRVHVKWIQPPTAAQAFAEVVRGKMHGVAAPVAAEPSTPVAPSDPIITQIQQLAGLRDAGAITDTEFETKKAELLARL